MQRGSLILKQAGRAGVATWIGFILGIGVKLMLAFTMVGIFTMAYILWNPQKK